MKKWSQYKAQKCKEESITELCLEIDLNVLFSYISDVYSLS